MFTLTFINCEKDNLLLDSQTEVATKSLYKVNTVKLSQIPNVRDFLIGKTNTNLFSRTTINGAIFDDDNILEVIDTLSNANYTFRFIYPNTPIGEFYNLIIGKTPTGELKTPFVLKYKCDESQLETYIASGLKFSSFKGDVSLHKYTDFFEQGSILGKTTAHNSINTDTNCPPQLDEVGDPIPCETQPVDGSGSGNGEGNDTTGGDVPAGGSTSGSTSGGSGSGSCTWDLEPTCWCEGDLVGAHEHTEPVLVFDCPSFLRNSITTNNDCPSCTPDNDGAIGINNNLIFTARATLISVLTLSDAAKDWVSNPDNDVEVDEKVTAAYNYLEANGFDGNYLPEAKAFDEYAVEAFTVGGDVDFVNEIILELDFLNNDCLSNVYSDMKNNSTSFKEYLQNFMGESPVSHLRFKYDGDFEDNFNPQYWNALAITLPPQNYVIDIIFNGDINLNASIHNKPKLIIAVAFIHEMIHAEIFRKMLSAAQTGNLDTTGSMTVQQQIDFVNNLRNDFPGLYDYYVDRWRADWGHQLMAQHYIDIIKNAVSEYDNNAHLPETYEAIAWVGLYDTIAWGNLTPSEQSALTSNLNTFIQNDTDTCN